MEDEDAAWARVEVWAVVPGPEGDGAWVEVPALEEDVGWDEARVAGAARGKRERDKDTVLEAAVE